jgi:PAS domain S-box-containing protein
VTSDAERAVVLEHAQTAGEAPAPELRAVGKNGKPLLVIVRTTAIELGGRRCLMSVSTDITERKRAEQEAREGRAKLGAALASMTDAVIITDENGRFVELNDAFARYYRFSSKAGCAKTFADFPTFLDVCWLDGTAAPQDQWPVPRALRGETVTDAEYSLRRRDSGETWVGSYSFAPIRDEHGTIVGAVVVARDVTEAKRAEKSLRDSEATLRGILNAAKESIWLFATDGTTLLGNETALTRLGLPRDRIIGRTIQEVTPEVASSRMARLQEAAATGPIEFEDLRAGILFEHRFYPVSGDDGRVSRIACFSRDITERRRTEEALRQSEARFRSVLDHSLDCIYRLNVNTGRYDYISPAAERIVGFPPDELMAQDADTALTMIHPADRSAMRAAVARSDETGECEAEYRQRTKTGEYRWLSNHLSLTRDVAGRPLYRDGTIRDITERKQVEEALKEARHKAEETLVALRSADQGKNEFLAMLSHELRNPLTPVRNSLYILDRAVPGSEQALRAKAVIDRQIGQLSRLVDDLLDITRITRNKIQIHRKPFELAELVQRTAEDHRTQFTTAGVDLQVDLPERPVWVNADAARVAQSVGNLLQNAAKFTETGGSVRLSLRHGGAAGRVASEESACPCDLRRSSDGLACTCPAMAVIRVRDTGAGISADVLPRLFQPFTQADNTLDRSRGGLGLGLALVKGLVELHGGVVQAQSDGVGKGAELTLCLPLEPGAAVSERVMVCAGARSGKRVLLIEDNVDAAHSLREVLELAQHAVEVAYDGPDGIRKARAFAPDVILCDIGLPGMNGHEVARALRAERALRSVFLVALTGYALPEDLVKAKEAGFDGHLAKPPNLEELERLLANVGGAGVDMAQAPAVKQCSASRG